MQLFNVRCAIILCRRSECCVTAKCNRLQRIMRSVQSLSIERERLHAVAIAGAGLAGLSCAKYLTDAGHTPIVLERQDVLGGKVAAWKRQRRRLVKLGCISFLGLILICCSCSKLVLKTGCSGKNTQWSSTSPCPGTYSRFDFQLPAPINGILAILRNNDMLTWLKILHRSLAMMIQGQKYVEKMDKYSWTVVA